MGFLLRKIFLNKTTLWLLISGVLLSTIIAVFSYQKYSIAKAESTIAEQKTINAELLSKLNTATSRIDKLIEINNSLSNKIDVAIANLSKLASENNKIKDTINTIKKEVSDSRLQGLADKKPGLIELKVNKATTEIFETLENETK